MGAFDRSKYLQQWQKENTVVVSVRLFRTTDADILEAIGKGSGRSTEIKRLVRLGMKVDSQSDSHLDETQRN